MYRFLFAVTLLLQPACYSQINPKSLDSLSRAIDSSQKKFKIWQDSFNKKQDSIYQSVEVKNSIEKNSRNLKKFIAQQKKEETGKAKQVHVQIAIALLLLIVLAVVFMRKRKKKTNRHF